MLLQNAGVYRRQAIETLVTGGWTEPVARSLGLVLRSEQEESWIRIRALFALGYLQQRDQSVESDLTGACIQAYKKLEQDEPTRAHVTEMHSALFAVGDCFGASGAEDRARSAREALSGILTAIAKTEGEVAWAARAAAYLLAVTAQPRQNQKKDLSEELLEELAMHKDPVTARLSKWALSFRFADDGTIRPLLAAAQYSQHDDGPLHFPD